jgi:predicted phage terminase large subunit-like protein
VCGDVWAQYNADAFLLDEICGTMDFLKAKVSVLELYDRHQDASAVLIEDAANGPAIINTLDDLLPCLIPVKAIGSKTARATDSSKAMSVLARAEAGNLYLPHPAIAPWVEDYVAEFAVFPKGAHDDRVDATVYAVRRLTENHLPGAFSA